MSVPERPTSPAVSIVPATEVRNHVYASSIDIRKLYSPRSSSTVSPRRSTSQANVIADFTEKFRSWSIWEDPANSLREPAGFPSLLYRHTGDGVAPIRVACPAQGANLKQIGRAWRQTINGDGTSIGERC